MDVTGIPNETGVTNLSFICSFVISSSELIEWFTGYATCYKTNTSTRAKNGTDIAWRYKYCLSTTLHK